MKKRKGIAMVTAVSLFAILFVIMSMVFSYYMNNSRMAVLQKNQAKAYYITLAGMELGTAALYQKRVNPLANPLSADGITPNPLYDASLNRPGEIDLFYDYSIGGTPEADIPPNVKIPVGDIITDTITFDSATEGINGEVTVTIEFTREDPAVATTPKVIILTSEGVYRNSNGDEVATDTQQIEFSVANPAVYKRTR